MSLPGRILAGTAFLAVLVGLASLDVALTGDSIVLPYAEDAEDVVQDGVDLPPVRRQPGPDVIATAAKEGFAAVDASEDMLVQRVLPLGFPVSTRALLKENDRAAAMAWIESPQVREIYANVKKQLRSSFSPDVRDLIDERQSERGKPPRDVLSFLDPAIHPDRILFVRVRQRLFEFHVVAGREADVDRLIDALSE